MLKSKLMAGVMALVLLGAIAGCGGSLEQPPETATTLDRTIEETIVVSEQPAEEANLDLEPPAEEANLFSIEGYVTVDAYHYDEATGTYIHFYHDESSNLVVDIGLAWIKGQLGDSPGTDPAKWISLSLDTTAPAAGWSQLEAAEVSTEITTGGLARAEGAYASTDTGNWTITKTFTALAPFTDVQLTGLQWVVTPGSDDNLFAANTFTPVSLATDDSLTITWAIGVAGP